MNIREFIKENILILDGGMGTVLQSKGLSAGDDPLLWNLSHPDIVTDIHKAYYDAGSNVVSMNTFGADILKFSEDELEKIIYAAYENCAAARNQSVSDKEKFIAFDIGPTGKLLKPFGELDFEKAVDVFSRSVRIADKLDIDLFIIETMNDSYETKAALLAVKENSSKPVFVTNAYGKDGKLVTGATAEIMAQIIESMGADAVGANCSFGPEDTLPVIEELLRNTELPVIMKPNAGMPVFSDGVTSYDVTAQQFAEVVRKAVLKGVRIAGGCCGTTPEYIAELNRRIIGVTPSYCEPCRRTVVTSYSVAVAFDERPVLIGERINPTGKKRFKQALIEHDIDYILKEGISQAEKGVHILDVNVGLAGIDEAEMLTSAVKELQAVTTLPLQLDSTDITALERAMRIYNGKPLVNSVNGKKDSMHSVFPLVRKYGGAVIALTLDEDGIPDSSEKRLEIAKRILTVACEYGIKKEDIIFDPLAMTVSTDRHSAEVTLESVRRINSELGCRTSLGVSNISFGLPSRDIVNSVFFTMALNCGLSAAIINPYSDNILNAYYSYCALMNMDENFESYIGYAGNVNTTATTPVSSDESSDNLSDVIFRGRKIPSARIAAELLKSVDGLTVINEFIIPALDRTGIAFERGEMFLPQLLMSAEAASAAFSEVKKASGSNQDKKCTVVLATVKGDIHDIGKNIVKLLLENYGFDVVDLGKDVAPEIINSEVKRLNAPLLGLSALMTTTLDAMKETIALVKRDNAFCRIFVGGVVVTEEFAEAAGADKYAKDAMASVRYADDVFAAL